MQAGGSRVDERPRTSRAVLESRGYSLAFPEPFLQTRVMTELAIEEYAEKLSVATLAPPEMAALGRASG